MMKRFGDFASSPRALMVSPEAPYPAIGGGPLRTACLLEFLSSRYKLDLIVFREPGAPDPALAIPRSLVNQVTVIRLPFHARSLPARVLRNGRRLLQGVPPLVDRFAGFSSDLERALSGSRYDVAVVEHFWCAGYGPLIKNHARRVYLDLHNIESVLLDRCATGSGFVKRTAFRKFASRCRELETLMLDGYDGILATSGDDRKLLGSLTQVDVSVYPNSIPLMPARPRVERHEIVFSGNLAYQPNASAILYFRDKIWPLLRSQWPTLRWRLIGKNHEQALRLLRGDDRIEVAGPVEDAVEALSESKIAVVPLLAGSGTRIKIIEAWAAGVPVVSTTVGAEGLPGVEGRDWLIRDTPEAFAQAVSTLLGDQELRRSLGEAGRALYENQLTWRSAWRELDRSQYFPAEKETTVRRSR